MKGLFSSKRVYFLPLDAFYISKEGGMIVKKNLNDVFDILKYLLVIFTLIIVILILMLLILLIN